MNKIKFYQFLVIGLLITNIILLAFMFTGKNKNQKRNGPSKIIIKKLNFSEEQVVEYKKLIGMHQSDIQKCQGEINVVKNYLYANLSKEPQDTARVDSLQTRLSNMNQLVENIHYRHFLDIKALCTPEQLSAYEELTKEMARIFVPHPLLKKRKD